MLSCIVNGQTFAKNASVLTTSTASLSPIRITINWTSYSQSTGYTLYRKLKSSTSWGSPISNLSGSSTQYIDNSVTSNTYYEYKLVRNSNSGVGYGYTSGSVNLSEVEYRGKMILVVDNTFSTSLSTQISQLESDLLGDGWLVTRLDVSRNSTPSSVKSQIQSIYNTDPSNFKLTFLLGHVPVYRSGNINPDGHSSIPWSCDSYYGEMNGTWTSTQKTIPTDMEMGVGRVDLYNLPAFGVSEEQLMINYLSKLHQFKVRSYIPQNRMILQDNLDWAGSPIAETGYRTSGLVGGSTNLVDIGGYSSPTYTMRMNEGFLFGYMCGGGTYNSADGIGSVSSFVNSPCNIVFTMSMGSYFGNWDSSTPVPSWDNNTNNLLKSHLASGSCLTSMYSGIPSLFYHHMGLGDNIGYSVKISQNNKTESSTYQPQNGGWQGQNYTTIHLSLLGDPSLRMLYLEQPSGFSVVRTGNSTTFNWSTVPQADGYHIYEIVSGSAPIRVNPLMIVGGTFTSTSTQSTKYMIRSVKLENTYSGSYNNLSLGVFKDVQTQSQPILSIKFLLDGPFSAGYMLDNLRSLGLVPTSDPYPSMGYNHIGASQPSTINPSLLSQSGNQSIIDWVVVELRSSSNPSQILQTIPCLIRSDGMVVNTVGSTQIQTVISGNYYISIKHRNHLGCMTASPVLISSNIQTIDFTDEFFQTWGTNSRKRIGSIMVLWSGDSNFDRSIKYTGSNNDRDHILGRIGGVAPTNVVSGYFSEDINMDGLVKYTGVNNDRDIILSNIGGVVPTNVINEQIP